MSISNIEMRLNLIDDRIFKAKRDLQWMESQKEDLKRQLETAQYNESFDRDKEIED